MVNVGGSSFGYRHLLMLNFYGYRSMNFELKKPVQQAILNWYLMSRTSLIPKANMSLRLKEAERLRLNLLKEIRLEAEKQELLFNIELDKDESDIIIYSSQSGNLFRSNCLKNGMLYNDLGFLTLLLILAMLYILYVRFLKKGSRDDNAVIMLVLLGAVFASYPLFSGTIDSDMI